MLTKLIIIIIILLPILVINNCSNHSDHQSPAPQKNKVVAERVGYWWENGSRVFTFNITMGSICEEIRMHAEKLPHTPSRVLYAFYYIDGAPNISPDIIKNEIPNLNIYPGMPSYDAALAYLEKYPNWKYSFFKGANGFTVFGPECQ